MKNDYLKYMKECFALELPKEQASGWRSCDVSVPEAPEKVIVAGIDIHGASFATLAVFDRGENKWNLCDTNAVDDLEVLYWMPLPAIACESVLEIYQLDDSSPDAEQVWIDLRYHQKDPDSLRYWQYDLTYTEKYRDESLNDVFYRFNMRRPEDFKGHSLSVSDVIVIRKNGSIDAWYVDTASFQKLPDSFWEEQ